VIGVMRLAHRGLPDESEDKIDRLLRSVKNC